jgi:NADH dehydrogenase
MNYISNIPENGKKRIVVVGAGFAGLRFVRMLVNTDYQIVLIDRNNYHQFQPLLYQVATSGLEPSAISFPLRRLFKKTSNVHFRIAELEHVDSQNKEVHTNIGKIRYDNLVLSMGAVNNFFGNEEIEEKSKPMKTLSEAILLRNSILENFETALNNSSEAIKDHLMNFVIVGGGPTGVELAGAIAEMKKYVLPGDYPELDFSRMRIILVEGLDTLLPGMSSFSSGKSAEYLKNMGVEVKTGTLVKEYDGKKAVFSNGESIDTFILLWAAGVKVNEIPGLEKAERARGGRYKTDRFNRLENYEDIFVVGDQAFMTEPGYPEGHPQVATPAIQQAKHLARNMKKALKGGEWKEFSYEHKGSLATIGRNKAVADLKRNRFGGMFAWLIWLFVHLMAIVGVKNRLFIFLNWAWGYFTYDQALRLIIKPAGGKREKFMPQTEETLSS